MAALTLATVALLMTALWILLLLAWLCATALLLLTRLLSRILMPRVILVLIGHSSISCVEPFNGQITSLSNFGFSSGMIFARHVQGAIATFKIKMWLGNLILRCEKRRKNHHVQLIFAAPHTVAALYGRC